jgi:antitoxin component YwqK of YwqJK toxin-antitoxin module
LWLAACEPYRQPHKAVAEIPGIFVNQGMEILQTKEGKLYYNNQPFSGWRYELYANRDTALLVPFFQGKEQGLARQWYSNGQLREERYYEQGEKTGEHRGWWENGKQRFLYHFQHDAFEGTQQEWNEAGLLYRSTNYKAGKENGLQQMWRNDGSVVANYVVRNGRNYGLTGVKNCKSVWEDEEKN